MSQEKISSGGIDRRGFLKSSAAVLYGAAASSTFLSVEVLASGESQINMQLGWLASNGLIGEVVAKSKGYYAKEGIKLNVTPGGPGVDGVASVAAGAAQIGQLSSSPSLMLARSAGIPVKCIAAGYQQHPFTYFSLAKNPIRTPKDMIGKTIATQPTAKILLKALLAKNGIAESDVKVVNMGGDMNQLLTGQAQAVTGWLTNAGALKILGPDRVDMKLWDTGIQLYANPYYVTDETLDKNFDVVVGFIRASAKGWGYAKQNPEKAVDMLIAAYPRLKKSSEMEAIGGVLDFSFNSVTKEHGWGSMNSANWEDQLGTYHRLGQFKGKTPKLSDVMTLKVLEATAADRPKFG